MWRKRERERGKIQAKFEIFHEQNRKNTMHNEEKTLMKNRESNVSSHKKNEQKQNVNKRDKRDIMEMNMSCKYCRKSPKIQDQILHLASARPKPTGIDNEPW